MSHLFQKWMASWNWKKSIPTGIIWMMYLTLFLIFVSAMGMIIAMLQGRFDLPRSGKLIPILWHLMIFYSPPSGNHYFMVASTGFLSIGAWLFSTRVSMSTKTLGRRMLFFAAAVITFMIVFDVFAANYLKPITYDKVMLLDNMVKGAYRQYVDPGALRLLGTALMMIPGFVSVLFLFWLHGVYREDKVVQDWFADYKFQWKMIGRFGEENAMKFPDINLAFDALLRVPIVLLGVSRQLGTLLIGPPGSGKTSLKITKAVRQDLAHMQKMINAFPMLVEKYGLGTKPFLKEMGKHLIGTVVIEPAKDLCDKSYQLAKDHGIPQRMVVYLDPSNHATPGINCLIGPIEQVAETITAVLDGMSEVSNEFFRQACRTVLKQYIYLLKFEMKNDCTILDLDHMYQDPRFTKDMVEIVRKKIPGQDDIVRMPQDMQIYWMLVKRTIRWFDNDGLEEERDRDGMLLRYESGEHRGELKIKDKQAEFTRQTRNLLADLITNPYLARILTGQNAVDLDKLMSKGGILLCNTDNGLLGNVSDAFGKLVLMSVQNAVFRRKGDEDTRPLVSVYVDEFYDYMNTPFLKLAGQGRKYKVAFLVACQSLSQFKFKFDEAFVDAMIGTIRNYIVYGGVGQYDAKKLMPIFGTQIVEEVEIRESISPEMGSNPSYSYANSVTREERELVSEDEIMFNKFKFSYIRLVVEGSTTKAVKAEGDFLDFGKADEWKKALNPDAVKAFMKYWQDDNDSVYTFDMNWIDNWGDIINPSENEIYTLTTSVDTAGKLTEFEEIKKTEQQDRERFAKLEDMALPLVYPDYIQSMEREGLPAPRASQIVYSQMKQQIPASSSTVHSKQAAAPGVATRATEYQTSRPNTEKQGSEQKKPLKPASEVVNYSHLFGKKPLAQETVYQVPDSQKKQDQEMEHKQGHVGASPETVGANAQLTKNKRRMEQLKETFIDVSKNKFYKQVFDASNREDK
ncbi:TraM recognition domain-containing protein [Paenibacillus sp. GP183]|uniref:type IV secretory system conjugative DNA transfer family protein n=1 Tax=Paenibacillus sp. GP183 TaxID=1882751 RepID=UPI00089A25C5|nr:TraM recognition domain-containing protein [Paenibacillus sp. GP183]SED12592.1 TraM recognition site of TraD and TraG [Paenibacillus sp. GP183]